MIAKDNKNIMITLSKSDLKKLEEYAKQKGKEIGFKMTKSQAISMLITNAKVELEKTTQNVSQPQMVIEARGNMMNRKDTSEMSTLQQMIYFLNYDCRLSYSQIGNLFNPSISDRAVKDYMYGKVKNPSEDKMAQLKQICKNNGKEF